MRRSAASTCSWDSCSTASRFRACTSCWRWPAENRPGAHRLEAWCQGGQIAGHKVDVPKVESSRVGNDYFWQESDELERLPVEPDALFTLRFPDRADGSSSLIFSTKLIAAAWEPRTC